MDVCSSLCMHRHTGPAVAIPRPTPWDAHAHLVMGQFDASGRRIEPLPANWKLPPWVLQGYAK